LIQISIWTLRALEPRPRRRDAERGCCRSKHEERATNHEVMDGGKSPHYTLGRLAF
jgi:hypothetical protein